MDNKYTIPVNTGIGGYNIDNETVAEVTRLIPNATTESLGSPNLTMRLANAQPWQEKALKGGWNFAVNALGMGSMMVGSLDPRMLVGAVSDTERTYSNFFTEFGKEFMEQNLATIYEQNPGSVNFTDPGWWFNRIGDTGSILGIVGETALETIALGGIGKLATSVTTGARLARITSMINKVRNTRSLATGTFAFSGMREAVLESNDVFESTYESLKRSGINEEMARENAAQAAAFSFRANAIPKAVLGALQARMMTYSPLVGLKSADVLDEALSKIQSPLKRNLTRIGLEGGSEAFEEGYQSAISGYAAYKADLMSDLTNPFEVSNYMNMSDIFNSAFVGFLGGSTLMPAVGAVMNKALGRSKDPYKEIYDQNITAGNGIKLEMMKNLSEAIKNDDKKTIDRIQSELNGYNVLEAIWLDNVAGKDDVLYSDYMSFLDNTLKSIQENNSEELSKIGIDENTNLEDIKGRFLEFKSDAEFIKSVFEQESEEANIHTIKPIVGIRVSLKQLDERIADEQSDLQKIKSENESIGLSIEQRILFDSATEIEALKYTISDLETISNRTLKPNVRNKYQKIIENLKKELTEKVENFEGRVVRDNKYKKAVNHVAHIKFYEATKTIKGQELDEWRDSKKSKEKVKDMFQSLVDNAKTKESVDNIKEAAQETNNPEIIDAVEEAASNKVEDTSNQAKIKTVEELNNKAEKEVVFQDLKKEAEKVEKQEAKKKSESKDLNKPIVVDSMDDLADDYSFYPGEKSTLDKSALEKVKFSMRRLSYKINSRTPSFKEAIEELLTDIDYDRVKSIYHIAVIGWEENIKEDPNRYKRSNYQEIYDNLFNSNKEIISELESVLGSEKTDKIKNKKEETTPPKYILKGATSNYEGSQLSFVAVRKEQIVTIDEQGNVIVNWENIKDASIFDNEFLSNSKDLANPDKFGIGTELEATIHPQHKKIPVKLYFDELFDIDSNSTDFRKGVRIIYFVNNKGERIHRTPTFSEYEEGVTITYEKPSSRKNSQKEGIQSESKYIKFEKDSELYWDYIPIVVYEKGNTPNDGLAFLHVPNWNSRFTKSNSSFDENDAGYIAEEAYKRDKQSRSAVREAYENNKAATFKITKKGSGSYEQLRLPDENYVTLREGSKDNSLLGFIYKNNSINVIKDGELIENVTPQSSDSKIYIDAEDITTDSYNNRFFELRKVQNIEGKDVYLPFYVKEKDITEEEFDSIFNAINLYLSSNSNRKKIDEIASKSRLDISTPQGLYEYLSLFINVNMNQSDAVIKVVNFDKSGKTYGDIKIGNKIYKKGSLVDRSVFTEAINSSRKGLMRRTDFKGMLHDTQVLHIDNNYGIKSVNTYSEYLKDHLLTDIVNYNVGTEDNPIYTPTIQPVIGIVPESQVDIKTPIDIKDDYVKEVKEQPIVKDNVVVEDLSEKEAKIQKALNLVSLIVSSDERLTYQIGDISQYNAISIGPEQRLEYIKELNLIPNLLPFEQEEIVSNIFHQLNYHIKNSDIDSLTKNDIKNIIQNIIADEVGSKLNEVIDSIEEITQIADEFDFTNLLSDLNLAKDKLSSIIDNSDRILDLVNDRLISMKTIVDKEEDSEHVYDKGKEEVNMKDQASFEVRKFFQSIMDLDKDGNEKIGFLGMPVFVDMDRAFDVVTSLSADLGSNYHFIIDNLKKHHIAYPWLWYEGKEDESSSSIEEKRSKTLIGRIESTKNGDKLSSFQHQFVYLMNKHYTEMKMILIDKSKDENLKVYDTNSLSAKRALVNEWHNNIKTSNLVTYTNDREYVFVKEEAQKLLDEFKSLFKTPSSREINSLFNEDIESLEEGTFEIKGKHFMELKKAMKNSNSDRYLINARGNKNFLAVRNDNNTVTLSRVEGTHDIDSVHEWTKKFGIPLSKEYIQELFNKGVTTYDKKSRKKVNKKFKELFDYNTKTNSYGGIFGYLALELEKIVASEKPMFFGIGKDISLNNYLILKTAQEEAKYTPAKIITSWRDGKKTIYGYTATNFITDRVRGLKNGNSIKMLRKASFNSQSEILNKLENNSSFRKAFNSFIPGKTLLKQIGSKPFGENDLSSLSDGDHEYAKIGFFQSVQGKELNSPIKVTVDDSTIKLPTRMTNMFGLTMSDKTAMEIFNTLALDLHDIDFDIDENNISIKEHIAEFLYQQVVKPELLRVDEFFRAPKYNIKGYNGGQFYLVPSINKLEFEYDGKTHVLIDYLKDNKLTEDVEKVIQPLIRSEVKRLVSHLVEKKLDSWKATNIIEDKDHNLNKKYLEKFRDKKVELATFDYVINYMWHNAEMFKLFAGDPANYFKLDSKNLKQKSVIDWTSEDYIKASKETFINVGKRLALLSAPGNKLSNSEGDSYIQLFIEDNESKAYMYEKLKEEFGDEIAKHYLSANETDAQEYTTWEEHLDILTRMGRMQDSLIDITVDDIEIARTIFSKVKDLSKLSVRERSALTKVLQPIKPVYTGQMYDSKHDIVRTVYVKSSSFPLIPQLTKGMELDKLRELMTHIQETKGMKVRASYQSANKVGAVKNPINLVDINSEEYRFNDILGSIKDNQEALDKLLSDSSLVLNRDNFRIQQDVPYKSAKNKHEITQGTQLAKLILGDGVLELTDFENGRDGKQIYTAYKEIYNDIYENRLALLNLDFSTVESLQEVLYAEADERGYTSQDKKYLELDNGGNFKISPAYAPNADKFEALLQSIINKRVIKLKIPGYSFVVGSEAGIVTKTIDELKDNDKNNIVWIDEPITGRKLDSHEMLIPSKLVHPRTGKLIDLLNDGYAEIAKNSNGKTYWKLNKEMVDEDLLKVISFRIPTSKHSSMSLDKIVGFLPVESGDLMIVSSAKTIMKGLDFDVDKENTYSFYTDFDENEVLKPVHKIASYNKEKLLEELQSEKDNDKIKEIREKLHKVNINELISIQREVLNHPKVHEKTLEVLDTNDIETQANIFDELINKDDSNFTPLSDEYQKQKMLTGASGKLGTAIYSNDVTFNSIIQQLYLDNPDSTIYRALGHINIGGIASNQYLGALYSVNGERTITDILSERQNASVDNEKLQVLGKLNLNQYTMATDRALIFLGLDKGEKVVHNGKTIDNISFFILNQPIIREFVFEMEKASSQLGGWSSDVQSEVVNNLNIRYTVDEKDVKYKSEDLTNSILYKELSEKPTNAIQLAVLDTFLELKKIGEDISVLEGRINLDSKGLGKSLFDTINSTDKFYKLKKLSENDEFSFTNVERLYQTIQANITDIGLKASSKWLKHYPYQTEFLLDTVADLEQILYPFEDDTRNLSTERKQELFKEFKKFLNSGSTSLFIEKDVNKERYRLSVDKNEKVSLAKYLRDLIESDKYSSINKNKLLTALNFEIETNGNYSLIKFDNASGEAFGEDTLKNAFVELLSVDIELPDFNGMKYSTNKLAQDLISYSFLEGGIQEATQFVKFIPFTYLEQSGYIDHINYIDSRLRNSDNVDEFFEVLGENKINKFIRQYIRHNPEILPKIKVDDSQLRDLRNNISIQIPYDKIPENATYIAVYDKNIKSEKKKHHLLYVNYERSTLDPISQLGSQFMSEYDMNSEVLDPQSVIRHSGDLTESDTVNVVFENDDWRLLSNFAYSPIKDPKLKGTEFKSVEQAFQYHKAIIALKQAKLAGNQEVIELIKKVGSQIINESNGYKLKSLGKEIVFINIKEWDEKKVDIMRHLLKLKFDTNGFAKKKLLETGSAIITHELKNKDEWTKEFPKLLTELRDIYKGKSIPVKDDSKTSNVSSGIEYKIVLFNSKNVNEVLDHIVNDNKVERGLIELAKWLKTIKNQPNVKFSTEEGYGATYDDNTKTISIGRDLLDLTDDTFIPNTIDLTLQNNIARLILHEYIHAITIPELKKYENNYENAPTYVKNLLSVFEKAQKLADPELMESMKKKIDNKRRNKPSEKFINEELIEYGLVDKFEFITELLTNKKFMEKLNVVPEGTSFLTNLKDFFKSILEAFGIRVKNNSLLEEGVEAITQLIENANFTTENVLPWKAEVDKKQQIDQNYSVTNRDFSSTQSEIDQLKSTFKDADGKTIC